MQLDIFEHSREVVLRNDVVQALERHDAAAARAACERLAAECPLDESLPALLVLTRAIDAPERKAFREHDALRQARQALQQDTQPAAFAPSATKALPPGSHGCGKTLHSARSRWRSTRNPWTTMPRHCGCTRATGRPPQTP